jgi:carboxypeptidase Taq
VVELAEAAALGESAWEHARPNNDWASFAGHLTRLVHLKREQAEALGYQHEPYDALLEEYEPGLSTQQVEELFNVLRPALLNLLARIQGARRRPNPAVLRGRFPRTKQEALGREAATCIGYDFTRGRLDSSAHPFTMSAGPSDVRITTRYNERFFPTAFFATLHETGHALYEQGLPAEHWGTPAGEPVSLGIHESQSRLWENLVGRSASFWRYFLKRAQHHCTALAGARLQEFVLAINQVEPSLIRVEADEVTYNLHILLRFELELLLTRGDLTVADLPTAWDEKMRSLLGLLPPDVASGVLQDVHWSSGSIGYFPTYTVGNVAAAQFFKQAQRDLGDVDRLFAKGEFAPFLGWLRRNVHTHGGRFWPRDLLRQVTGEDLSPACLIEHLNEKYTHLYKL